MKLVSRMNYQNFSKKIIFIFYSDFGDARNYVTNWVPEIGP